jgi:hypothetical protein
MKQLDDYLTVKEFRRRAMKSDKTIRRLVNNKKSQSSQSGSLLIVKEKGRLYLHQELLSLYVSDFYLWLEQNRFLRRKTNIINDYAKFFKKFDWTWFCHVSYEKPYNVLACHSIMERFFERLQRKFPQYSFRLLFASEKNVADNGFHNHFVLYSTDGKHDYKVKEYADSFFRSRGIGALTKIERYDENLNGVNYILKDISLVPDGWDILP